jgi:PST family polysaccharide transporter
MALRGTVWTTIGNYLSLFVSFGTTLVLTRLILPDAFGIVALAAFWAGLFNLRAKSGLLYAASQQRETGGTLLGTYLFLDVCIAAVTIVVAAVTSFGLLSLGLQTREVTISIMVMLIADAVMVLAGPWQMALEKELQISRLTLITLLASGVSSVVAIGLAVMGQGVISLLSMSVVTSLVSVVGIVVVGRRRLPNLSGVGWRIDRTLARDLLARGLAAGLSLSLLVTIAGQYDNFLIGTFVGKETLGFYDRAYRIATWPNVLLTLAAARVGLQMMTRLLDDPARLAHAIRLWYWMVTTLGVPMALVLCFGATEIVGLLYGPQYAQSVEFLRFLSITNLTWTFSSIAFWLSVAAGNRRVSIGLALAQSITLVVVATPLTWLFGVTGTLVGVAISMVLAVFVGLRYVFATVRLKPSEVFGVSSVTTVLTAAVLYLITHFGPFSTLHGVSKLVFIILTTCFAFGLVLLTVRRVETIDRFSYLLRTWNRVD